MQSKAKAKAAIFLVCFTLVSLGYTIGLESEASALFGLSGRLSVASVYVSAKEKGQIHCAAEVRVGKE
jgi:hypothetical protein